MLKGIAKMPKYKIMIFQAKAITTFVHTHHITL